MQEQVADLSLFHTDLPEKMGLKRTYLPIENEAACVRGADTVRFNQLSPAHQSGPVEHQYRELAYSDRYIVYLIYLRS